jgi:hypothetical protein
MSDTVIFMSAYETTKYSKSKQLFKKSKKLTDLLEKHHIPYIMFHDKLLSPKGALTLNMEYDYVTQKTKFSYSPVNKKHNIEDYDNYINSTGRCIKLLHTQSVLSDPSYFKIDYFINLQSFIVYIDDDAFQIDPMAFSMNGVLIIIFEMINLETAVPLKKEDVFGKIGNYNLRHIKGYSNFGETFTTLSNHTIPELIYNNINAFLAEMIGNKFVSDEYSFVHNTLVLSNEIDDIEKYFCDLIGIKRLSTPLENISTTDNYQYYLQDGASVVTKFRPENIDIALYNAIMLESMKLYIYLFQIINAEITIDMNKVMRNDLYLENLFFAPRVPIETNNLLSYIYKTKSFQHRKEAVKLKLAYMTVENETKKNRNAVLLNILLYVVSLLSAISALETLENKLNIPFKYSFIVVVLIFGLFGAIWGIIEYRRNKRF